MFWNKLNITIENKTKVTEITIRISQLFVKDKIMEGDFVMLPRFLRFAQLSKILFWVVFVFSLSSMQALPQSEEGKKSNEEVQAILDHEIQLSKPDYIVYRPGSIDGSTFDTGNEHFLVFDGPDGSLMAVWTQSSYEGAGDHRIVFSQSDDEGKIWLSPKRLVGPSKKGDCHQASWGFPLVSHSGRIYVIYNQFQGLVDCHHQFTGTMDCIFSDDLGKTWSIPQTIPMPRSPYDHPDETFPSNWIVWQKPERLSKGKYFVGFTRWVSTKVRTQPHINSWTALESVVEFMRFENIDDDPEPKEIKVSYFAWGENALRVPHYSNPLLSLVQEPSIVRLPDNRFFCAMRTMSGYIWYSVSEDEGETWCAPRPLLRRDKGKPILQPICCCPIYEYSKGRYILLHHNNDGRFQGCKPEETGKNRRPAFIALGEFRPDAEQPIWFSRSKQLMDNDGIGIGPLTRIDLGVYTSISNRKGNFVLWHPDRKFFLLGKRITFEWLADLKVPEE